MMDAADRRLIDEVLGFWFSPETEARWFDSTPEFDRMISERFGALHDRALAGELDHWMGDAAGALALLILLDQFPRNMFRGTPRAFESDGKALTVSKVALENGFDKERPLEHSENPADQVECVRLFRELNHEDYLDYAIAHHDIVARFGRFPHRNAILGRQSSEEEQKFLKTHKGF
jgi:uncharacterized protein (DUF924 family)